MILRCDIISTVNTKRVYGLKGEPVSLIRDCGNVLLVRNENGECFPVIAENIVARITEDVKPVEDVIKPVKNTVHMIFNQAPALKKTKNIKQQSLF